MPGSTGAIRAGRAFVELFADDSKLVRGLKRASAKLKAFGEAREAEGPSALEGPEALLAKIRAGVGDMGDILDPTLRKTIGAAGTFSAAAL